VERRKGAAIEEGNPEQGCMEISNKEHPLMIFEVNNPSRPNDLSINTVILFNPARG